MNFGPLLHFCNLKFYKSCETSHQGKHARCSFLPRSSPRLRHRPSIPPEDRWSSRWRWEYWEYYIILRILRILLMMIQLSGIPVEERFSNHPKSKLSLMPRKPLIQQALQALRQKQQNIIDAVKDLNLLHIKKITSEMMHPLPPADFRLFHFFTKLNTSCNVKGSCWLHYHLQLVIVTSESKRCFGSYLVSVALYVLPLSLFLRWLLFPPRWVFFWYLCFFMGAVHIFSFSNNAIWWDGGKTAQSYFGWGGSSMDGFN